jgi:hypothetical protein
MAKIFDIAICPVCNGEKDLDAGQVLKDAKIYLVRKLCSRCKGHGRIGVERKEMSNGQLRFSWL